MINSVPSTEGSVSFIENNLLGITFFGNRVLGIMLVYRDIFLLHYVIRVKLSHLVLLELVPELFRPVMQVIERHEGLQIGPCGKFNVVDSARVEFHEVCDIIYAVLESHPYPVLFFPVVSKILFSINRPLFGSALLLWLEKGLPLLR